MVVSCWTLFRCSPFLIRLMYKTRQGKLCKSGRQIRMKLILRRVALKGHPVNARQHFLAICTLFMMSTSEWERSSPPYSCRNTSLTSADRDLLKWFHNGLWYKFPATYNQSNTPSEMVWVFSFRNKWILSSPFSFQIQKLLDSSYGCRKSSNPSFILPLYRTPFSLWILLI